MYGGQKVFDHVAHLDKARDPNLENMEQEIISNLNFKCRETYEDCRSGTAIAIFARILGKKIKILLSIEHQSTRSAQII